MLHSPISTTVACDLQIPAGLSALCLCLYVCMRLSQALMGSVSALRSEVGEVEGCMALIEDAQFAVELMEASEVS